MRPASGLMAPTMPLNRVDLPAPFGPTTAISAPVLDRAVEMMHRRMAVVAEREIAKFQRRGHVVPSTFKSSPRRTTPHSAAMSTAAIASRSTTDMRRIEGAIAAGGCPSPGW